MTAVPYAKEKKMLLGTGVEFSCQHKKTSIHILGYDFSLSNPELNQYCVRLQTKRKNRNLEILDKLRRLQIVIEESDLLALHQNASTLGRPHIAAAMVEKGYVRTIQEAFAFYLGDNKCCYVPGEPFPVECDPSGPRQSFYRSSAFVSRCDPH
jgi:3',5'-nucleoside bisphosphate phosphatase